ncbi:hypothetical protein RD110_14530 [Rhodoferax koreense]|uniref:NAD-dependent epimerase/dehydratase domain-containing protein n=1 Tax=Rhodoferax koreensis TaxID=1842727 RepID=A0A1P8JWX7_9BURK|nr:NAD(P)-dependent oxidoreductase [Rhodoferax koreense]APW38260.1 hypothetical protein RD110_14530 [Rhodoferax koreense]
MTTLITGGAGFVGLALAERLRADGEPVVLFDRAAPRADMLARLGRESLSILLGDIRCPVDVDAALKSANIDRVVHCAAVTPDADREARDPMAVLDVNVGGTANLLQRCAVGRSGIRRILVLSSVAVYGVKPPAGETYEEEGSAPAPAALYGIGKLASEQAALRLAELYRLDVRVARLGPVYGPWEYATGVRDALSPHAQVLAAAMAGQGVVLPRSLRADWIYSRDAAKALAALADATQLRHTIYNVGGAVMSDLVQWCALLAVSYPGWSWRLAAPGEQGTLRYNLPVDRAALSIARLQADTGWAPATALDAAARDHLAWQASL